MNSTYLIITFLFIINFLYPSANIVQFPCPTIETQKAEGTKTVQAQVHLIKQCKQQTKIFTEKIVKQLALLNITIDYWKQQKLEPFSYFITRGPFKWFSSTKQYEEVENHLACLTQEYERLSYFLGRINYCCDRLDLYVNTPLTLNKIYTLLKLIECCINFETFDKSKVPQNPSFETAYALYQHNQNNLSSLSKKLRKHMYKHMMPGHMRQHWLRYSILTGLTAGAICYVYENQEESKAQLDHTIEYIKELVRTKIASPIKTAYNTVFNINNNTIAKENNTRDQENKFRAVAVQFKNYMKEAHPEYSSEQIDALLEEARSTGSLALIDHDLNMAMKNPLISIAGKEFIHIVREIIEKVDQEIEKKPWMLGVGTFFSAKEYVVYKGLVNYHEEIKKIKELTDKALEAECDGKLITLTGIIISLERYNATKTIRSILDAGEEAWEQLALTRAALLISPLLLGVYGLGHLTKKCITKLMPIDKTHKHIQKVVHIIHRMVNTSNQHNKLSKHGHNGLIIYHVHELKQLAEHVEIELRASFIEDCKELASFDLTREQKLIAIEQMYRRYHFLCTV